MDRRACRGPSRLRGEAHLGCVVFVRGGFGARSIPQTLVLGTARPPSFSNSAMQPLESRVRDRGFPGSFPEPLPRFLTTRVPPRYKPLGLDPLMTEYLRGPLTATFPSRSLLPSPPPTSTVDLCVPFGKFLPGQPFPRRLHFHAQKSLMR